MGAPPAAKVPLMTAPSTQIPILDSLTPLLATTDAWISDIWGVLHDGVAAFPGAGEACVHFRDQGGTVILVTNAPRPEADVARMLERLGIPRAAYDTIITSGDLSRGLLADFAGRSLFHLGPERLTGILGSLDMILAPVETADVVLCTGLFDDENETPEQYRSMLAALAGRDVPLICANPDLMVERGPRLVPCAGSLAEIYRELGGTVHYAGKPYGLVYERAFAAIAAQRGSLPPKERILAIGDGLRTDVEGAGRAGLRCVFIASALHLASGHTLAPEDLAKLFAGHPYPPVAAMSRLAL